MRVLRDVNAEIPQEMDRFPSTIKKKGKPAIPLATGYNVQEAGS